MKIITGTLIVFCISVAIISMTTKIFAASDPVLTGTTQATATLEAGDGGVAIMSAPYFSFGQQKLSSEETTVTAKGTADDGTTPVDAQISDARGTGSGWSLQVSLKSPFQTSKEDGAHLLQGAVLTIGTSEATSNGDGVSPSELNNQVTLNDAAQPTVTASQSEGMGTWNMPHTASLTVSPMANYIGTYSATIDWSLVNGPAY
ncbi:WxL domain-containing protein [Dellaglioa sp. L3N]